MFNVPLSPYANIFFQEWKLDPKRCDYNIIFDQEFETEINISRLDKAIKRYISQYVIFNSHVLEQEGKLLWVNNPELYGLEILNSQVTNSEILSYVQQAFNLEKGPLYKFYLVNQSNARQRFIVIFHHILIDGMSFNEFVKELSNYYNDEEYINTISIDEQALNLEKISEKFSKYIELHKGESQAFWEERLAESEPLNLNFLQEESKFIDDLSNIGEIRFNFGKDILLKLNQLKKKFIITPYLYSQNIFSVLLYLYTEQENFCLSYPIVINEGRDLTYGAQVNTNIISYNFKNIKNILDVFSQSREFIKSLKKGITNHTLLLISYIIDNKNKALINVAFNQTKLKDVPFVFDGIRGVIQSDTNINLTNDLLFAQEIHNDKINFRAKFKKDRINFHLLDGFVNCYKKLFVEVLEELIQLKDPSQINDIRNYTLLSSESWKQIIYEWNATDREYSKEYTIQELFEEQVEKTPNTIALIYEENRLSYRELNNHANRFANYLREHYGIKADDLIVLCLERSEHMLISILAVLKAGGAYVPIDPSYPKERIEYVLKDSATKLVITNEIYQETFREISGVVLIDNTLFQAKLLQQSAENPNALITSNHLAYVIYTSGTTGNPKGVMIDHQGVVNRIQWMNKQYPLKETDKILQKTPYTFDVSVWELLWANWYGASIVFAKPEGQKDIEYLIDLIKKEHITIVHFVPSMLNIFLEGLEKKIERKIIQNPDKNPDFAWHLRYIFCSGEALSIKQVKALYKLPIVSALHNLYGPTETSIDSLYYDCTNTDRVCIGKPISNTKVYVLNADLIPVPVGAIGELYLGGIGLARGYLNRPELTAERFIANPFQTAEESRLGKNARLYKTGDLVRWLADGNLEYIGRNDFQVKIRGYRIELGEIENVLCSYSGIKQAVVLARGYEETIEKSTENKYLVAYYVVESNVNKGEEKNLVDAWNAIYQSQYSSLDVDNFKHNITSWISSYTNETIDTEDMAEWVNAAINQIKRVCPKVILEVGSGSGLMLFNLQGCYSYYYATDISRNSIDYINQVIQKHNYSNKISTIWSAADTLPYSDFENPYDTVILNSVIQYFPSVEYLESVISKIILNMKESGQIFIGDIRDYRLLKYFHYSILKYKNGKTTKDEVDYFSDRDKELLISPAYFITLKNKYESITSVEVMPKLGKSNTEMNNYRYDVILHINKKIEAEDICVEESKFVRVLEIEPYLDLNSEKEYLYIKYPNARIIKEYIEYNTLVSNIIDINEGNAKNILAIREILIKAEKKGYDVKCLTDIFDPIYVFLILYKENNIRTRNIYLNYTADQKFIVSKLYNHPMITTKFLDEQLTGSLKNYLRDKLPEYMVPEQYVKLGELPITANGKLDRKALLELKFSRETNYKAPKNDLELKVCTIWSEILNVPKENIGIEDDFFRLGGNSILAIRLASRLNRDLGINIHVSLIFEHKTVANLIQSFERENRDTLIIRKSHVNKKEEQALSFGQERIWFIEKYESGSNAYNAPLIYKMLINESN